MSSSHSGFSFVRFIPSFNVCSFPPYCYKPSLRYKMPILPVRNHTPYFPSVLTILKIIRKTIFSRIGVQTL
jgi:hypothetical protein